MKQSPTWFDVYLVNVKSSRRLFQIFVAFSECLNFNIYSKLPKERAINTCNDIIATSLFYYMNGHCFKFVISHKKLHQACPPWIYICKIKVFPVLPPMKPLWGIGISLPQFFVSRFQESNSCSREFESSINLNKKKSWGFKNWSLFYISQNLKFFDHIVWLLSSMFQFASHK